MLGCWVPGRWQRTSQRFGNSTESLGKIFQKEDEAKKLNDALDKSMADAKAAHERSRRLEGGLWTLPFVLAILSVLALGFISLFTGVYDITGAEDGWQMFFITRVPRTAALMLTGAAMAMSGLVMQLLTQNRFVEPTTTGMIERAGLGLVFVYVLIPSPTMVARMTGAIIFAFIGTMVFFGFLRRVRLRSSLIVPIIGIMLGAVISAVSTFVGLQFDMMQSLEVWFAGSFAPIQRGRYEYLWIIIVVTIVVFIVADRLTVAGLGEDIATNLGLNYSRIVLLGTVLVAIATGVVAAVVGQLPFLDQPIVSTHFPVDSRAKNNGRPALGWAIPIVQGAQKLLADVDRLFPARSGSCLRADGL